MEINIEKCRLMTSDNKYRIRRTGGIRKQRGGKRKEFCLPRTAIKSQGTLGRDKRWGAMIKNRAVYKSGIEMTPKRKL